MKMTNLGCGSAVAKNEKVYSEILVCNFRSVSRGIRKKFRSLF